MNASFFHQTLLLGSWVLGSWALVTSKQQPATQHPVRHFEYNFCFNCSFNST